VRIEREIAILKDLVRTTCHGADICAAALQAAPADDPHWPTPLEQIREDRRLLLVDLVRCLLLRGLPEAEVRAAMTEVVGPADPEAGLDLLRIDLEIAERKLDLSLRRVLADALVSQPTLELLSLHYLRLQMRPKSPGATGGTYRRHRQLPPIAAPGGGGGRRLAAATAVSRRDGTILLN
jgi:hypothetical protein